MKKLLSLILALALVISLVPNVVFAETAVGTTKTFYFAKVSIGSGSVGDLPEADGGKSIGIDYLPEKSTSVKSNQTKRLSWGTLIQVVTEKKQWKDAIGNESQLVFTADLGTGASAGWYQIAFTGGNWYPAADLYIYANDTYVGDYIPKKDVSANEVGSTKTYGAVYLTPDATGKVEFKIAVAKIGASKADGTGTYSEGRILLNSLSLTYLEDQSGYGYKISHTIPVEIDYKANANGIEFTAYADAGDGIERAMNGIKSDRSTDGADSFSVEVVEGDSVTIEKAIVNGVCTGKLVPQKLGDTTIKFIAVINGQTYTDTKTVSVTNDEPMPVTLDFTQTGVSFTDKTAPVLVEGENRVVNPGWTTSGFSIVPEKTTTEISRKQNNYLTVGEKTTSEKIIRLGFGMPSRKPWPINNEISGIFTIKASLNADGNYSMRMLGAKNMYASQFAIYVDDTYVGDYKGYDDTDLYVLDSSYTELNDLDLKKGDVEISFRLRKPFYTSGYMVPYSFEFIPNENPVTVATLENYSVNGSEDVTVSDKKEVIVGTTENFKARVKMTDGNYRSFGYTNAGVLPEKSKNNDGIYIESSNPDVVEVKDVVCVEAAIYTTEEISAKTQEIDPTTTTYSLVAKKPGTAEINVTAIVNGKSESAKYTVTVPYTDGSDAAQDEVSYIVRGSKTEFNAGIDVGNYVAGKVGSHPLNTSFTASAKKEITVGNAKYSFAYWQTAGGVPVEDAGARYTFTPKSNFTLEAVYVPVDATTKTVQFWNYNKVFLGEVTAEAETLGEKMPEAPSLNGWSFDSWMAEGIGSFNKDTILKDAITRVVAQFTAVANKFSVKVNGAEQGKYTYGAPVRVTAQAAPEGKVFSHWTVTGSDIVVCYESTMDFYAWNDVDLTPVYAETAPSKIPTVVLDKVNADEYFIAYVIPSGYTPVDAGIVFSENGVPSVESSDSKASVKQAAGMGQFTAAPGDDSHTAARGYVMYKDNATGDIRVIYSK